MVAPVDISVPQPIALAKPHQLDVLLAWDCDCDCDCEIVLRDINSALNPPRQWTQLVIAVAILYTSRMVLTLYTSPSAIFYWGKKHISYFFVFWSEHSFYYKIFLLQHLLLI